MYNEYYLLKRVEEEQGAVSFASVQDSFTFKGEVVQTPFDGTNAPQVGDKVLFLKGSGEDVQVNGETYKVVKFNDLIMKI
jgi:co-chaperonin GroES (HSP10)